MAMELSAGALDGIQAIGSLPAPPVSCSNAAQGLQHLLAVSRAAAAEIIILDPLYSAHDQDENHTRAMAAVCQSLRRLREASRAALVVVHHVRKSIRSL